MEDKTILDLASKASIAVRVLRDTYWQRNLDGVDVKDAIILQRHAALTTAMETIRKIAVAAAGGDESEPVLAEMNAVEE